MATLTISKVSACSGGNHFTIRFALGAQSIDIDLSRGDLDRDFTPEERRETLIRFLSMLASQYTPAQLANKINAGISITL